MQIKLLFVFLLASVAAEAQTTDEKKNEQADSSSFSALQEVVVTANRDGVKRSEAPVAIASINQKMIRDARATSVDQLLNKVSGVYMVNLGNEQHQMSIRQPITTKSLFLYLQDGIPIRTSGLFNHNALLEMNMATVKNIEVIKGPSSSLYGSEAIGGVVNFITHSPSKLPELTASIQGNNIGYRRADMLSSFTSGKFGFVLGGYYAAKRNGFLEYSDFTKGTATARIDYTISASTKLSNTFSFIDYHSDMPGGVDSTMFAGKSFRNPHTFTYRKVNALRNHLTLHHEWTKGSRSSVSLIYRHNSIGQNPAYRVADDYRKLNGEWKGNKELAHGEINRSSFRSYAFIAQHKQELQMMRAVIIAGVSSDISPSGYKANYIRIHKDTSAKKYRSFERTDSLLSNYNTGINNYAGYINVEFSPAKKLRVVSSVRYDLFTYRFDNKLHKKSYSGSPDTVNHFKKASSKIGATYQFTSSIGVYANYSEGFIPPQVTEMYNGVSVPALKPSTVRNYEAGGWIQIFRNKLTADISIYKLNSTNEVISVKLDDGSFTNRNAGKTMHRGLEIGLNARPVKGMNIRIGGAYSEHRFIDYKEKGQDYSGKEMNGAPRWITNAELWYAPSFVKGLKAGIEMQHVGKYFADAKNTARYSGYTVFNLRAGYQLDRIEWWVNALNVTDRYYSTVVSKSAYGYSYTVAEPVNINAGMTLHLGNSFKKN